MNNNEVRPTNGDEASKGLTSPAVQLSFAQARSFLLETAPNLDLGGGMTVQKLPRSTDDGAFLEELELKLKTERPLYSQEQRVDVVTIRSRLSTALQRASSNLLTLKD